MVNTRNSGIFFFSYSLFPLLNSNHSANLNTVNLVMNFITTTGIELFHAENRMLSGKVEGKPKMLTD